MAIVRFRPLTQAMDPFRDVTDIQGQMNRLFDNLLGRPGHMAGMEQIWAPAVDMYETKDELVIAAELPGLNQKDIHLSITGDMLTLRGERQPNQEVTQQNYYRGERWWGKFERALPLPIPVQAGKVRAAYRDGVLTVTLPKADEISRRRSRSTSCNLRRARRDGARIVPSRRLSGDSPGKHRAPAQELLEGVAPNLIPGLTPEYILDVRSLRGTPKGRRMDTAKKILAKLLDGLLPTHEPLKCWAGSGTGSVCNGCDAQIVSTDVEHELDFDNPPTVRLHAACDAIWRKTTSCRG